MEPRGLLPHSQVLVTCPNSEPAQSVHNPLSHILKIHLYIILPSVPESLEWSLSLRFPRQNPVYASPLPIRATSPAHIIFLDFITRKILGEYRSLSSPLRSFLLSPVTLSLLWPNIFRRHKIRHSNFL